jgi:hypothetical protein
MASPARPQTLDTHVLDCLFQLAERGDCLAPSQALTPAREAPLAGAADAPSFAPAPPPGQREGQPWDVAAASEWLTRERARLEAYTRAQLSLLQAERQAMLGQHYLNEQATVLRVQELNRKEEFLARHSQALQAQAAQLSQRERALLGQLEQRRQAQEELVAMERTSADMRQEVGGLPSLLEAMRAEVSSLQAARDAARAELGE